MKRRRILVDTSVWISYFRGSAATVALLDPLLDSGRVVISGQIMQEVLQGSRDAKAFDRLQREMRLWSYEAETPADFLAAALIFARLRWDGKTVPPSDCLVAAVALRSGLEIFAEDRHYLEIPDLRLYAASASLLDRA